MLGLEVQIPDPLRGELSDSLFLFLFHGVVEKTNCSNRKWHHEPLDMQISLYSILNPFMHCHIFVSGSSFIIEICSNCQILHVSEYQFSNYFTPSSLPTCLSKCSSTADQYILPLPRLLLQDSVSSHGFEWFLHNSVGITRCLAFDVSGVGSAIVIHLFAGVPNHHTLFYLRRLLHPSHLWLGSTHHHCSKSFYCLSNKVPNLLDLLHLATILN